MTTVPGPITPEEPANGLHPLPADVPLRLRQLEARSGSWNRRSATWPQRSTAWSRATRRP